jgi:hypothetical protein
VGLFHSNAGKNVIYNFSLLPVIEMNSQTIWNTISVMLRKILGICIKPSVLYNKKNKHKKYKCTRLETYGLLGLLFNTTFNKFQWGSVLLVEENGVHRENHGPVTSHWQTLSHNAVSPGRDSNSYR